jgi:site-specific DNA-methyltransferase (adenine-specific)
MWNLHLGDFIEGVRILPSKSVDHTIMDPPFEGEAHSAGRRIRTNTWKEWKDGQGRMEVKQIAYPPITELERRLAAYHAARITRRWILVFCQSEAAHLWRAVLEGAGARYIRTGIYWKSDAQPQYSGDRPGVGWEAIVIAHGAVRRKISPRMRWNGGGKCARWTAAADARFGKKLEVDGQKPEDLMVQLVEDFTDVDETVADFFAGYGTTGVACIKTGRHFVGWEKDAVNHGKAQRRLGNTKEQLRLITTAPTMEQMVLI